MMPRSSQKYLFSMLHQGCVQLTKTFAVTRKLLQIFRLVVSVKLLADSIRELYSKLYFCTNETGAYAILVCNKNIRMLRRGYCLFDFIENYNY